MKDYKPKPIDISEINLDEKIMDLVEKLAENTHEVWAKQRLSEGWVYGEKRDDKLKTTPCLVPYADLPENEKEYDRITTIHALKTAIALGATIKFEGDLSEN